MTQIIGLIKDMSEEDVRNLNPDFFASSFPNRWHKYHNWTPDEEMKYHIFTLTDVFKNSCPIRVISESDEWRELTGNEVFYWLLKQMYKYQKYGDSKADECQRLEKEVQELKAQYQALKDVLVDCINKKSDKE